MKFSKMAKKVTILLVIAILISGLNISLVVNAGFDESYKDDGILVDEFDDDSDLFPLVNCSLKDGTINLSEGTPEYEYNYRNFPDNVKAWVYKNFTSLGGLGESLLKFLLDPSILPDNSLSKNEMLKTSQRDDNPLKTESEPKGYNVKTYSTHRFQFELKQKAENIKNITLSWWFGDYIKKSDANIDEITIWIWNYGSIAPHWSRVSSPINYSNSTVGGDEINPDFDYKINDEDQINEILGGEDLIDVLIIASPIHYDEATTISTDKIEAFIESKKGYKSEGHIISKTIEIEDGEDFVGWDKIMWESSRPSGTTSVTIQVLDEENNLINNLSSTKSPLDITSIKKEKNKIRLKAILKTNSPELTPRLYSWGIIWQKEAGYKDSFNNTYRISKSEGLVVEGEKVQVSNFYSDWNIFGKNSANTRSYSGKGIEEKPKGIYWYTKGYNIGGEYRHVVAYNGKIYVPSSDDKIYIFDEAYSGLTEKKQEPYSNTTKSYKVDACIGVSDDILIVGTNALNKPNKIYALSASNLSEIWEYKVDNDPICFSSPPTIDDGRVFITSWSGISWQLQYLPFINSIIPANNYLIGLNLDTKDELWDPIPLPAGSFSAPALGENKIFVGCQNIVGSSLFAYDADTGEEIWNTSVGIIGKSSPVYADGKVFILSNEKENLTSEGTNLIVAVDASTGEKLWNKTIGKPSERSLSYLFNGKNTDKVISSSAPVSTPAYYDDTLFVLTPDGQVLALNPNGIEKWSYNISGENILSHYLTSPMVVGDTVYIVTGRSRLFAFDINQGDNVKPKWDPLDIRRLDLRIPNIVAPPIIADGVLFLSVTEDPREDYYKLYCVGEYTPNSEGYILSSPIHVPNGYWWDEFKAYNNTLENNTIDYQILDENDKVLVSDLNGTSYDISDLNTNVIKLYAKLEIVNRSETLPQLKNWEVTWVEEKTGPVFVEDSFSYRSDNNSAFKKGYEGWIGKEIYECFIEVKDKHSGSPGINIDSGKFRIIYLDSKTDKNKTSAWYETTSEDESGSKHAKIYANIEELDLDIYNVHSITFSIEDLAGNKADKKIEFRVDTGKPTSYLVGNYNNTYKKPFIITVEASDEGESTVYTVLINYRYKENPDEDFSGEWKNIGETGETSKYNFEAENSGYYQIIPIAVDKASNQQDIPTGEDLDDASIVFLFDMNKPVMNTTLEEELRTTELPTFDIEIFDDFKLNNFSYSLDDLNYTKIAEDIDNKTYTIKWSFPANIWESMNDGDEREVFFKITDFIGNENKVTTLLIKDENASKYFIDISDFSEWHWDNKFTVKAVYPDETNISEIKLYYKYSKDKDEPKNDYIEYDNSSKSPYEITFNPENGSGYYWFKMDIVDSSGHVNSRYAEVNVTLLPTTLFIALLIVAIILIILIIFILRKIRKK